MPTAIFVIFSRYVPCCDVENDLWGESHFNFEVEKDINYHVLRTGAFPFIKFHCSKRRWENLQTENILYCFLKIINLGKGQYDMPRLRYKTRMIISAL